MLVNKHQLLFRTGHFITQSSDTLRIHSFPGEFVQQVFVHGCQQFIGFLPFGSNGQVNFFLFVTDQELVFIDQHRRLVYDYEKDKREFFDRMDEFRNEKQLAEKELEGEKEKFRLKEEELNLKERD